MSTNLFAYPAGGPPGRLLPTRQERVLVTVVMSRILDLKLEVCALLEDLPKNELVLQALDSFLAKGWSCGAAHGLRVGPRQKRRITFTLNKEIDGLLGKFAQEVHCHKTCAVTAAVIYYLQSQKIDLYSDPIPEIKKALRVVPARARSSSS